MNAVQYVIIIALTIQSQAILAMNALAKKQGEVVGLQLKRERKAQEDRKQREQDEKRQQEELRKKTEREEKEMLERERKAAEDRKQREQEEKRQQEELRKKAEREEKERIKKQEAESKTAFGSRPLIILFDPYNDDMYQGPGCGIKTGAMIMSFKDALEYSIPIIADCWFLEYAQTCSEARSSLSKWEIYTLKDKSIPLMLLIPKQGMYSSYLAKLKTFSYGGGTKLSDGELLLGIKLHNLDQINASSALPKPKQRIEDLACLKDILITHNDLKGIGDQFCNRWDIFLTGHGSAKGSIAGMAPTDFTHFLNFLNGAINTRSLFYDTCFAGAHLTDAYQYAATPTEIRDIDFNFTIISATTFSKQSYANAHNNFQEYFTGLDNYFTARKAGDENIKLTDIVQYLNLWEKTFAISNTLQLPTIRFPHTGWFKITDIDTRIFRLNNSIISRTINQGKKEIKIPTHAEMILVESLYIPVSIIIEGSTMPLIIPFDITNQDYFFREIIARQCTLTALEEKPSSFQYKLKKLLDKCPNVGKFLIETLIINIENLKKADGSDLAWNDQPITLKDVVINPKESIRATVNNEPFQYDLQQQNWNLLNDNQTETWSLQYYQDYNLKPDVTDEELVKNEQSINDIYKTNGWDKYEFATKFKNYLMTRIRNYKDKKYSGSAIEQIRKTSTLPESMKGENPKSIIEQPLLHRYLQNKGTPEELEKWKKTLSSDETQKLETLIKTLPAEMPALPKDITITAPSKPQSSTQANDGPQTIEAWSTFHKLFDLKPNITDEELAKMKKYINAVYENTNSKAPSPYIDKFKDDLMERIRAYEEKKEHEKKAQTQP